MTPEQLAHLTDAEREAWELCQKATPDLKLRQLSDGLPRTYKGEDYEHTFEPEYFKYVDGQQVFCAAYDVEGLNTLGNCECSAMEMDNAAFVVCARTAIPELIKSLVDARESVAQAVEGMNYHAGVALALSESLAELRGAVAAAPCGKECVPDKNWHWPDCWKSRLPK